MITLHQLLARQQNRMRNRKEEGVTDFKSSWQARMCSYDPAVPHPASIMDVKTASKTHTRKHAPCPSDYVMSARLAPAHAFAAMYTGDRQDEQTHTHTCALL